MGLVTDIGRWNLDEACLMVGRRIEKNLNEGKEAFDGFTDATKSTARKYRSAKTRAIKKVKIKSDGTW